MGYYFFLNRVVVLWSSKKQKIVSISITKAKYITLKYVAREALQIRQFINKFKVKIVENLILNSNNKMSIAFTKNIESQYYIKHIDVQYHYIRELVNGEELTVKQILGSEILANGMIKRLLTEIF